MDDYFCRNCCSNGIARSLSYKDVAFYTSSRYRQEVYLRNHAGFGKCDWELFTKKHIVYYIFFIILYRLAEGFIMKVAPLFLRASREVGGLGLSLTEIGTLNGVFGSAAFVIGSLLGGIFVARYGLKKTLFMLCCVFNLPFLAYTFLAVVSRPVFI